MSATTSSLTRRMMQSRVSCGSRRAGVSGGIRSGSTKAKMLIRSSIRFSMGVPLMAQLRLRWICRAAWGVVDHAGVEQQPQRDDDLRGLSQPHLVGDQRRLTRHQEGNALDLVRIRLEGQGNLLLAE